MNAINPEVYKTNEAARKLLKLLHDRYFKHHGKPQPVSPVRKTREACGVNLTSAFEAARQRLYMKKFAQPATGQGQEGWLTITDLGVEVAESMERLDGELPIGPRAETPAPLRAELAPDVAPTITSIRETLPLIVADAVLRSIVERDAKELEDALRVGLHKSASMLAGSITEAVLLDVCDLNPPIAATHMGKKATDYPAKASLDNFIAIACGEALIEELTKTFATAVKNYRDLIHPDRERRENPTVNATTSSALVMLLRLVVENLKASHDSGRFAAYKAKQLGGGGP
jgi:hypothetical protein